ncbi:hypothetical protein [Algoriphagus namhaensis]
MNQNNQNRNLLRQRLSVALALLFCMFFSSLEYSGQEILDIKKEYSSENSENENQTFLSVAVDAVVPFALQITQTVFHLIYQILNFEGQTYSFQAPAIGYTASLGEVFFERIISPQGP